MKPLKEKISITLDSDILEKLKDMAEYDGRSLSSFINLILKRYLENVDKKDSWFFIWKPRLPAGLFLCSNFVAKASLVQREVAARRADGGIVAAE